MALENNDELLVNRSGTTYTVNQQEIMAEIQGDDLLLVNRSGTTYTATGQELIDSVIPELTLTLTFVPNIPYIDQVITAVANPSGGVEPDGGFVYTYQWSTADDIDGANRVILIGENENTYTPTEDQRTKFLGCQIQTTDERGLTAIAQTFVGPIDFKPPSQPPAIESVVLTQDQINDKRFSSNSFTTTVTTVERATELSLEAQVVGALSLEVGTDLITTNDDDGEAPLTLTLASNVNLGDGRFEVGDAVKANESYTPTSSLIEDVTSTNYASSIPQRPSVNKTFQIFDGTFNRNEPGVSFGGTVDRFTFNTVDYAEQFSGKTLSWYGYGPDSSGSTIRAYYKFVGEAEVYMGETGAGDWDWSVVIPADKTLEYVMQLTTAPYQRSSTVNYFELDGERLLGSTDIVLTVEDNTDLELFQTGDIVQIPSNTNTSTTITVTTSTGSFGSDAGANKLADGQKLTICQNSVVGTSPIGTHWLQLEFNPSISVTQGLKLLFWETGHWQQLSINGEAYTGEGSPPLGSEKPVIAYNGLISKIRLSSTNTSRSAGALSGIGWDGVDLVITPFPSPETQPAVNSFNAAEIVSTDLAANTITVDSGNWGLQDTSQSWSTNVSGTQFPNYQSQNAFNGIVGGLGWLPDAGTSNTWTANLTVNNFIELNLTVDQPGTTNTVLLTINGQGLLVDLTANTSGWYTVGVDDGSTLNSITLTNDSNENAYVDITAIKLDGVLLVDKLNQDQIWSEHLTCEGSFSGAATSAFDGDMGTVAETQTGGAVMTFTSPVAFPAESTLELYGMDNPAGSYTVTVNGKNSQSVAGGEWQTITYDAGDEAAFVITLQNNAPTGGTDLNGIRIGGVVLADTGVREVNDDRVSTVLPKQGQGTISDITGDVVSINPFTDNCFKEGQYLIHTTPKPIKITPKTEQITAVDNTTSVLTLAGNDELIEFANGDPVTMCDAAGNTVIFTAETDEIITVDEETITGHSMGGGTVSCNKTGTGGGGSSTDPNVILNGIIDQANQISFSGTDAGSSDVIFFCNPTNAVPSGERASIQFMISDPTDTVQTQAWHPTITKINGNSVTPIPVQEVVLDSSNNLPTGFFEFPEGDETVSFEITFPANNAASGLSVWGFTSAPVSTTNILLTFEGDKDLEVFQPGDTVGYSQIKVTTSTNTFYSAGPPQKMFDGSNGSTCSSGNPGREPLGFEWLQVEFIPPVQVQSTIDLGFWYADNRQDVSINGGGYIGLQDQNDWNLPFTGELSTLRFSTNSGNRYPSCSRIGLDGTNLVFDVPNTYVAPVTFNSFPQNVISVDAANDQMIVEGGFWSNSNQSEPWSRTGDFVFTGEPAIQYDKLFDGESPEIGTTLDNASDNGWRIGGAQNSAGKNTVSNLNIPFTSSVKIKFFRVIYSGTNPQAPFRINGIDVLENNSNYGAVREVEVSSLITSPITSWEIERAAGGDNNLLIYEITVDGRPLVDAALDNYVWSEMGTAGGNQNQNAFDGDINSLNQVAASNGDVSVSWNLTNLPDGAPVEIKTKANSQAGNIVCNGVTISDKTNTPVTTQCGNLSGTILTITQVANTGATTQDDNGIYYVKVDNKYLIDAGVRNVENTVKIQKSGTGEVDSVNLETNTMTLVNSNNEWITGYYVQTPEKNAVEMRGYLSFDSLGENLDLERLPQAPILMDDFKDPTITFPSTFSTGEGADTDLPYPTYLETYVVASNVLGSSNRVKSNELFPDWTARPVPAAGSYRVMQEEFGDFCYWACSSDYRSAIVTIQDAENTVQELRTKAQLLANNYLDRADTADWEPYNTGSTGTTSGSSGSGSSGSGSSGGGY